MSETRAIEPDRTVVKHFETIANAQPEAVAFEEVHPKPDILPAAKGTASITFGELDGRSNRIANSLIDRGVEPGDIVAYQLPNWVEFPLVNLAVQKVGAVSTPILAEHRSHEVGFMVDLCESDVVVIPSTFNGFDHVEMLETLIADGTIDPTHVFVVGEFHSENDRFEPFAALEDAPETHVNSPLVLDDLDQLMFTSGTTGEPKGVRQTARTGLHQILTPNDVILRIDDSDVIFGPSPLAHNTGYQYFMRLGMYTGAKVVLFDRWLPGEALATIEEKGCTFCAGATTFLKDLLDHPEIGDYDLSSLRLFFLAGAPIPEPVVRDAYDDLKNLTLVRVWGQTENGMVTATRLDDPIEKIAKTDGRALPHAEVTVRDEYEGEEVRNERGKLLMRGSPLMDGYYRRPEITEDSFTDDGWFKTGDLAVLYDDEYISIDGRDKDIIIRGGENISAPEVEELVLDHPAVQEVAIVAMPDERLQERPCAYVKLTPDGSRDELTVEELSAYLTDRGLQIHKHPERIEFVDEFPRTSPGKIQKFKLREDIAEKVGGESTYRE